MVCAKPQTVADSVVEDAVVAEAVEECHNN